MTEFSPDPHEKPGTAGDPELQAEFGELLAEFRSLEAPEPTERLTARVRARVWARGRRERTPHGFVERLDLLWVRIVAAVGGSRLARAILALLAFVVLVQAARPIYEHIATTGIGPAKEPQVEVPSVPGIEVARDPVRVDSPADAEALRTWLSSENDLRRLRRLLHRNVSVESHYLLQAMGSADPRTRARIENLASAVAADLRAADPKTASIEELSLGMRALLLSGSTTQRGPHARVVRATLDILEHRLPKLQGEELVVALGGYLEAALLTGGHRLDILATQVSRFAQSQHRLLDRKKVVLETPLQEGVHPNAPALALDTWSTDIGVLADAGLLLRLAPALGVPGTIASELRDAFRRHLEERAKRGGVGGAAAQSVLFVSYSDLVDREELHEALRRYRFRPGLMRGDLRALQLMTWTTVPPTRGWTRSDTACRQFVAGYEAHTARERAVLLLIQLRYLAPKI